MTMFLIGVLCLILFVAGFGISSLLSSNSISEKEDAERYLTDLFRSVAPQCIPGESLMELCMQIDNYIAGERIKIEALELELKKEKARNA